LVIAIPRLAPWAAFRSPLAGLATYIPLALSGAHAVGYNLSRLAGLMVYVSVWISEYKLGSRGVSMPDRFNEV
jgi:hypothetical protein